MRTKLFFSWILTVPAVLIASIVAVIFAHYSAFEIVATFLIPLAYCIFNSLIGLVIAIRHPKLKWNSEAEAVKNSAAVLIALLVDFGVSIIFGAVLIAVPLLLPNLAWIAPTIVFAIIVIGALCSFLWLNKNFAKKIDEIEDL